MFSDNLTQKIAEAAKKIMDEQLKGNQKKIDKNHNNKIDGQDFAILRGEKKANEEVERIDELSKTTLGSYVKKAAFDLGQKGISAGQYAKKKQWSPITKKMNKRTDSIVKATDRLTKEEIELEEGIEDRLEAARAKAKAAGKPIKDKPAAPKSNVRKIEGHAYGGAKQKDEPEEDDDDTPAKKTVKYGARQNFVRSKRVNESFTEMLSAYREEGLKFVADTLVVEEPTEEEFNAEIKKAQDKSEGKDKAEVAKASVQAVKNEEVEVIDADQINGVEEVTIDERHMTDSEMNKREKIVKSMKKGLSGFKQRYGDRAKNVMYATAAKIAKEKS
jgi:hypothetical protein